MGKVIVIFSYLVIPNRSVIKGECKGKEQKKCGESEGGEGKTNEEGHVKGRMKSER